MTHEAGIWDQAHGSSASWTDVDNDGYVDLYVANYGIVHDASHYTSEANILYHNNVMVHLQTSRIRQAFQVL